MAAVMFVFVREDASEAESMAEAFDANGYSVTINSADEGALSVVIWSGAALYSPAFKHAAERALRSGRALVASLIAPPPSESVFDAPVVDLRGWDGEDAAALDPLFETADRIVLAAHANVIALPSRPVYEDAEFTEPARAGAESDRARRARSAWEAPIPTDMLRPARAEAPKTGAPAPRRDFTRLSARKAQARANAALAFAVVALVGAGVFAMRLAPNSVPQAPVAQVRIAQDGGVSLTSASADATGLDDVTPTERPPLFEPAPQGGYAGVEPPSARAIGRAAYAPRRMPRDDSAAYQPPALIPEATIADLERDRSPMLLAEQGGGL